MGPHVRATKDIGPGDYACNEKILRVLRERHGTFPRLDWDEDPEGTHDQGGGRLPGGYRREGLDLPGEPNFRDAELEAYVLDEETRPELRFHRTTSRAPSWATGARAVASGRATTSS